MAEKLAGELIDAVNGNGEHLRRKKIHIEWQKLTKHLHITNGKIERGKI